MGSFPETYNDPKFAVVYYDVLNGSKQYSTSTLLMGGP